MKRLAVYTFSIFLLSAVAPAQEAPRGDAESSEPSIGFTWWNDVPELVRRGNEVYYLDDYKDAEQYYRDAQFRDPDEAVSALNLGLSLARQDDYDAAARHFEQALNLAGERADLRERALYNLGNARLEQAMAMAEAQEQQQASGEILQRAIDALDAYDGVLRLNPENSEAEHNKKEAQYFIRRISQPPPEQQDQQQQDQNQQDQQQQQQNQDQQDQQDQQQQEQQQSDQEEEGQEQQQQQEEQQEEQEGQQEQEQERQQNEEEEQQQDGQPQQPQEMTEEQARQLLNLLGDEKNIVLRKSGYPRSRPQPEKDW